MTLAQTLRSGALAALIAASLGLGGAAYAQTTPENAPQPPAQSENVKPTPVKKAHHHRHHRKTMHKMKKTTKLSAKVTAKRHFAHRLHHKAGGKTG